MDMGHLIQHPLTLDSAMLGVVVIDWDPAIGQQTDRSPLVMLEMESIWQTGVYMPWTGANGLYRTQVMERMDTERLRSPVIVRIHTIM